VGEETKRFNVSLETTYSLAGVTEADLTSLLEANVIAQVDSGSSQKVYDAGVKTVKFDGLVVKDDTSYTATVRTKGYVGPKIDDASVAKQSVGKRAGEIQQQLGGIDGVDTVGVQFNLPWVSTAPGVDKISVKFLVKNAAN
jgi:hypothetical protein